MDSEPKDLIVLGAVKHGMRKFNDIQKITKIPPEELNSILEQLEDRGFIKTREKKGWFSMKIEIITTDKGDREVDQRVHELQTKWQQMSLLYKTGDKEKLKQEMQDNKSIIPTMMFFGIIDMMMFSMMFSMMGMAMTGYGASENVSDAGEGGADGAGADGAGADGGDGGGFDFDIGF